jgi:SAM-dependent methyltransferase
MPDAKALARMYGPSYAAAGAADQGILDPKEPQRLLEWLRRRDAGTFVDFGCGSGALLLAARDLGWVAAGVEFQADVVRSVATETGCVVLDGLQGLRRFASLPADVIHLGDVIEHLTEPLASVRELVESLRPGGWLVAQGPLEAGPSLYATTLRLSARLRPSRRPTEMPPYHVLQATVEGQRLFFERLGLEPIEYLVSEVAWPAPARLSLNCFKQPKNLALFFLRRVSQVVSALNAKSWGNRYFFVGTSRTR